VGGSLLSFNVGGEFLVEKNFSFFGGYEGRAALDRSGGYQSLKTRGEVTQRAVHFTVPRLVSHIVYCLR